MHGRGCSGVNARVSGSRYGWPVIIVVIGANKSVVDQSLEAMITKKVPITVQVIEAHLINGYSNNELRTAAEPVADLHIAWVE